MEIDEELLDINVLPVPSDELIVLKNLRMKNPSKLIFGHININSIRNKFELLRDEIESNVDILLISETKLDDTFPSEQFLMDGFSAPYRIDRNTNGGGLMLFVREGIPYKNLSKLEDSLETENFFIEINLKKKKWLLSCSYNPKKNLIQNHLHHIMKNLDYLLSKYENVLLIGDFNVEVTNTHMDDFCHLYNLKSLIKDPTCYKNPTNPSCIDLMITNQPKCFCHSQVIDLGLSDYHSLTITMLKSNFEKQEPRVIKYRDYRNFSNELFHNVLVQELSTKDVSTDNFSGFQNTVFDILNKQAPLKEKHIRRNNSPFLDKALRKAIMARSRFFNKFKKKKSKCNWQIYVKQRNYCLNLLRKRKKDFYNNLDVKKITDNKRFWKTVKPSFSDKYIKAEKITLIEKDNIVSDDKEISKIFCDFFGDIVKNLNIELPNELLQLTDDFSNPLEKSIKKYENHPSIIRINQTIKNEKHFLFNEIDKDIIEKEIDALNKSKACQESDIPIRIIKDNKNIFAEFLYVYINLNIEKSYFPTELKKADVKPIFKKDCKTEKSNYRPISILPNISKIFEHCLHDQLSAFFDDISSPQQCGFRKGYNAQYCLIALVEKCKHALDKRGKFGALLTDLSKAFDCLPHDLLIAKLNAYGIEKKSLSLIHSYLSNRKQRVKINSDYSPWGDVKCGVPQGSILGPLLFNVFICDLFMFMPNHTIANYADDNTPYSTGSNMNEVILDLQLSGNILFSWLKNNGMKANTDKSHLLLSQTEKISTQIYDENIINTSCEKLLGVKIDRELKFDEHVKSLCKKANQKLSALTRLSSLMSFDQRKLIMNAFITSHFSYCPLVWMLHSRKLNERINKIHERSLRVVYQDYLTPFDELLTIDNSKTIHHRNLQKLMIEIYKIKNGYAPTIINSLFEIVDLPYNLRNDLKIKSQNVRTVFYGTESLIFLAPRLWNRLPNIYKSANSLTDFKIKIRDWQCENCPCRLCKTYVSQLGFL